MELNWILYTLLHWLLSALVYKWVVSKHSNLQFQRMFLLVFPSLSLFVPFFSWNSIEPVAQVTEFVIYANPITLPNQSALSANSSILEFILSLYVIGILFVGSILMIQWVQAFRMSRKFPVFETINRVQIRKMSAEIPSFSFFNTVCLHRDDWSSAEIRTHEMAHAQQFHSFDRLYFSFLKILFWFNPMIWWFDKQLEIVHELLADKVVVSASSEPKLYAEKLIQAVIGFPMHLPVNTFFKTSGLQKRIHFILNKNNNLNHKSMKYTPLMLILLVGISIIVAACNQNSLQIQEQYDEQAKLETTEFGSMSQFLGATIKYPESAKKDSIEGKVLVEFVVHTNGSISDVTLLKSSGSQILDDEAIRVVKAMPNMIPAKKDGKPVNTKFVLPFNFKLSNKSTASVETKRPFTLSEGETTLFLTETEMHYVEQLFERYGVKLGQKRNAPLPKELAFELQQMIKTPSLSLIEW